MGTGDQMTNELLSQGLSVVPAKGELATFFRSCIVIDEAAYKAGTVKVSDIIAAAASNGAEEDNSEEEAGDDKYAVQFPGEEQRSMDYDQLVAALRGPDGDE